MRRIVTGHDDDGNAVIRSVDELRLKGIPSGDAAFATIWSTAEVPVDLNDETDGSLRDVGLTLNGGSVLRVVDMLPGGESPMHRTNSLDYGIVISGEVELELDDGAIEVCRAGDVIVQRGTIHLWRNTSPSEPCRIVFALTQSASAYKHNGVTLEEIKP
ncbi:MAG: cupin domain-containing protein [Woeseiaceae bacterium]